MQSLRRWGERCAAGNRSHYPCQQRRVDNAEKLADSLPQLQSGQGGKAEGDQIGSEEGEEECSQMTGVSGHFFVLSVAFGSTRIR